MEQYLPSYGGDWAFKLFRVFSPMRLPHCWILKLSWADKALNCRLHLQIYFFPNTGITSTAECRIATLNIWSHSLLPKHSASLMAIPYVCLIPANTWKNCWWIPGWDLALRDKRLFVCRAVKIGSRQSVRSQENKCLVATYSSSPPYLKDFQGPWMLCSLNY